MMNKSVERTKIKFGVLDAVVIIAVIALVLALVFRYTTDKRLFTYETEKYAVTVKACGLQYTTMDLMSSNDTVFMEDGSILGTFTHAPTVTPTLKYSMTSAGDMVASYYPDNTLVDMVTEIECELIVNDGMIMTKSGAHVATGVILEVHTQTVDFTVEITEVEKIVTN